MTLFNFFIMPKSEKLESVSLSDIVMESCPSSDSTNPVMKYMPIPMKARQPVKITIEID